MWVTCTQVLTSSVGVATACGASASRPFMDGSHVRSSLTMMTGLDSDLYREKYLSDVSK